MLRQYCQTPGQMYGAGPTVRPTVVIRVGLLEQILVMANEDRVGLLIELILDVTAQHKGLRALL